MAGPWEKYAQPQEQQSGPWAKYATNQPDQPAELPVAEADQAPSQMPYGEQMRKAFGAMGRGADGFMRGAANGLSFGMADRLAAAMGDKPYEQALKDERQKTADAPLSGAGNVAGMIGGGVGLAKSGVTLAGRVGEGLLPRVLGYGAEGAAYGAAQEAGNNDGTPSDKLNAAKHGAMVGGGIGASLPIAGSLMGKGYQIASALMAKPVDGANRSANALLRLSTTQDDLARFDALGPNAMLADASPTMLGLAQGAATKPGSAKDQIVNALTARDAGTSQRLQAARDTALGPRVVPSQVEAGISENMAALGPEYEAALGRAGPVDTKGLAAKLDLTTMDTRGDAQSAAKRVRDMLNMPGTEMLDTSPRALLETRKAVDGMTGATLDNNVKRVLTGARSDVDAELAARVPGIKPVDAKYAEQARQKAGLERGQEVFDTARSSFIRPEQLADEMSAASRPKGVVPGPSAEPVRMRQGMNAEVDRKISTGSDDLRALEGDFRRPANAEKLRVGFGDEKANTLLDSITQNRKYRDTLNAVDRNSQTAQRSAANAQIEGTELALPEGGGLGGLGIRLANKGLAAISGRSNDSTRQALADMLTRSGPEGRKVIEDVLSSKNNADQIAEMLRNFASKPGGLNSRVGAFLPDNREQRRK